MFTTTHNLDFLSCDTGIIPAFKIGTCNGQWGSTGDSYYILTVINDNPGNGHLDDVFEWFEHSCKRDKKNLLVLSIMNERFQKHLIEKRGFKQLKKSDNVIKIYNKILYTYLLINGNEVLTTNMNCR